jgi:hypothetical protein
MVNPAGLVSGNSPPGTGGVDARSPKYREATLVRADGVVAQGPMFSVWRFWFFEHWLEVLKDDFIITDPTCDIVAN